GVRDPGDAVGEARSGGDRRDARSQSHASPAVRAVYGGLLVPEVDDLDAEVDAPVVDRCDVSAREREQVPHPLVLQRLRDKVTAVLGFFHNRNRPPKDEQVNLRERSGARASRPDWRSYDVVAPDWERVGNPQTEPAARDLI